MDHLANPSELFGSALAHMSKAAEFAVAIDDLSAKLIVAQKRRADLVVAEDRALFGDGNYDVVHHDLKACDEEIDTLEKAIEGASRRRTQAATVEQKTDMDEVVANVKSDGEKLAKLWKTHSATIEKARQEHAEIDRLTTSLTAKNQMLIVAGRSKEQAYIRRIQRDNIVTQASPAPTLSRKGKDVDKLLAGLAKPQNPTLLGVEGAHKLARSVPNSSLPQGG